MKLITKSLRGSVVESFNLGYAVAVDETGEIIFSIGNPEFPTFLRSAAKPFQATAILEAEADKKYNLTDEELAVICSSHKGEIIHTDTVTAILKKLKLKTENLKCGVHRPIDKATYEKLILTGGRPSTLHNTCSGKHAGMLALASALKLDVNDYLSRGSIIHSKIMDKIKLYSEVEKIMQVSDDCGLPTFFLPLKNIADMYRKLVSDYDNYLTRIFTAMTNNPQYIAGRDTFDTDFTKEFNGKAISKAGSQGLRAIGIKKGKGKFIGIAVKVLNDNKQASASMALEVMNHLKLISSKHLHKLAKYHTPELLTYSGEKIGKMITEIQIDKND